MKIKKTGQTRKLWVFFKRGRSELQLFVSLISSIFVWYSLGNLERVIPNLFDFVKVFVPVYVISSLLLGYYVIKKVDTTRPYINPFTQDNINSSIYENEALIEYMRGNNEKAIELLTNAQILRKKWVDKID